MQLKILFLASIVILFTACGGSSSSSATTAVHPDTPQTIAIDKVKAYADDNTLNAPTVKDYTDAGVTGVTDANIDDINAVVASLTAEDVDTQEEIQSLVDDLEVVLPPDTIVPVPLILVSTLNDEVRETSGLVNVNGKIYTHNDSGGSDLLYEINASTGEVIRSISVNGATNVDWEDLAYDDTYFYIADIGNNLGNRTDLKIYKILKSDLNTNLTVEAETIAFSYIDQTTFTYDPFTTPYDAEALIAYNGQLYVFTKNWADHTSKVYSIPTVPGSYEVTSVSEKSLDVMVTGAAIDGAESSVALIGYTNPYDTDTPFKSMIVKLSGFTGDNFFSGSIAEYEIKNSQLIGQVEAILFNTPSEFYLSAEGITVLSVEYPAKLYKTEIIE